jgi:hypothetical protein
MPEMLLLDPIHEVDEQGWPNIKTSDNKRLKRVSAFDNSTLTSNTTKASTESFFKTFLATYRQAENIPAPWSGSTVSPVM